MRNSGTREFNILMVRSDRIGDVVLSTPAFLAVKRHFPRARLTVLVREAVAPLLRGLAEIDEVLIYEPEHRHRGLRGFWRLLRELRARKFRVAVILHSQWFLGLAVFLAGIRYRVGPLSKLHSYFFYNRGVRQNRSQVEMHEADYNLQLLRRIGVRVAARHRVPPKVFLGEESREKARRWLVGQGWSEETPLVVIHPGMGGSALNWPETHYVELAQALLKSGLQVLITGGPLERELIARLKKSLVLEAEDGAVRPPLFLEPGDARTTEEFAGFLAHAAVVVAPSTGPLHMAVALGVRTVSFFPPIRVQSALRWGPYTGSEPQTHDEAILIPEVFCGEDFRCRGAVCHYFPCMRSIPVRRAYDEVQRALAEKGRPE